MKACQLAWVPCGGLPACWRPPRAPQHPVLPHHPPLQLHLRPNPSQVKYMRSGDRAFEKAFSYPPRPTAPWSYPQTGVGLPLPLEPPYNRMLFFAAGGSSEDRAEYETPASDEAHIIDVSAVCLSFAVLLLVAVACWQMASSGAVAAQRRSLRHLPHPHPPRWRLCLLLQLSKKEAATWTPMGPMPTARVMGDGVILCDGTILLTNGAATGTAVRAGHACRRHSAAAVGPACLRPACLPPQRVPAPRLMCPFAVLLAGLAPRDNKLRVPGRHELRVQGQVHKGSGLCV